MMKAIIIATGVISLVATALYLAAIDGGEANVVSKEEALKRFMTLYQDAEVVALANIEDRDHHRSFTFLAVWKGDDRASAGTSIVLPSMQRSSSKSQQAVLFFPEFSSNRGPSKFPLDRDWATLSISDGALSLCRDVSVADLQNAVPRKTG